jgi:hypothetical protein
VGGGGRADKAVAVGGCRLVCDSEAHGWGVRRGRESDKESGEEDGMKGIGG